MTSYQLYYDMKQAYIDLKSHINRCKLIDLWKKIHEMGETEMDWKMIEKDIPVNKYTFLVWSSRAIQQSKELSKLGITEPNYLAHSIIGKEPTLSNLMIIAYHAGKVSQYLQQDVPPYTQTQINYYIANDMSNIFRYMDEETLSKMCLAKATT